MAHYQAGPDETRNLAHKFFEAMDEDNDGKVDIHEFMEFMAEEGYGRMNGPYFFHLLDTDKSETLDFPEVMTLYYILKSGRPFCRSCKQFLTDEYFACLDCFESPAGPYCLCLPCYSSFNWAHNHNRPSRFLDNYTLLEVKRIRDMNQPRPTAMLSHSSSSNAIVPAYTNTNKFSKLRAAFKAFETALGVANITVSLSSCSIM